MGFFLIPNQEKSDGHHCGSGKVALTQGGKDDVCHHLNGSVRLATNKGPRPQLSGVEGYHHVDFRHIQAIGHRQSTMVDRSVPVVAEMEEYVV
jgi:hypothetical protein